MKRWISILLIASLLLTFLPAGGAAQAETTVHSHNGWKPLSTVSSVSGTLSTGNYYLSSLTNSISATGNINIDGDVTLCLNGKVLDLRGYVINVGSGDHLTICDCSSATHCGNIGTDGLWQASASSGSCNLTGGVITSTGSSAGNSSAVSVEGGGSLTLASGNIAGTSTDSRYGGGGVFVYGSNSSFTMEGGSIIGNCADQKNGGGVSVVSGSFTMTGGSIANNTASGNGGGYGGGVYVTGNNSSFSMEGGSISGNSATQWGGGVSVNGSSFTMSDGSISGNTASSGGGVHVSDSSFTMSGGQITKNKVSGSGGVGGGVVLNNSSSTSMTLSGDVGITGNTTAAGAPSNVYLAQDRVITIGESGLTTNAQIGVSMAQPGVFTSGLLGNGSLANFASDDSDYILLSPDGGEAALHAHSYTYSAESAVITQACTCGHHATATLSVPTDCTYDGQVKTASMQYGDDWQGSRNWTISYTKDGQSVSEVTEAGTYTASVTIDRDATASVTFTIEKASQEPPSEGEGYAIDYGNETITVEAGYEVATAETGGNTVASGDKIAPGDTLYIHRSGDSNHTPSDWTALRIPERPATPDTPRVTDKTDTSITIDTESGKVYCIGDEAWITGDGNPHTFSGLTAGTDYTITVRVPATDNSFASESASASVTTKTAAAAAPDAPSDVTVTASSVTVADSVSGQQYVVVPAGTADIDWSQAQSGNGSALTFENLNPGTAYVVYTRTAETEAAMPSQASSASVTTAAAAPNAGEGYVIDYGNETITVKEGYEVRVDGKWQTGTITFAPGTAYEVRKAKANGVPASEAVAFTTAARPAKPGAAVTVVNESIKGKGDGAVEGITSAMEYKLGDGEWISGTGDALTNLAAGTTVGVRLKATNAAPHGEAQTYTVKAGAPLTVTFESNGGSTVASMENLSYDASITAPTAPTKTGYTFAGWHKDAALNQAWNFENDTVTADTTLYAKWTANTNTAYTVKHWQQKLDAGSEETAENYTCADTENRTGTTDESVTPALKAYEGFTAPNAQMVTIAADGSTVVNYYYTRNRYTVSLSPGTGIASVRGAGTYAYGAAVTIAADVKTGYSWQQWSDGNAEQRRSFTMGASDVSLTAQASLTTYTITCNLAGGTLPDGDANPDSYTVESAAITLANPTKTGYTFAGWTGTGLDEASKTVTIAQGSTGDRAYTATWAPNEYTITYEGMEGAEYGDAQPTSHTYGTATTISNPTKTGYTFAGWRVNGSSDAVKNLTLAAEGYTAAITLTATWTANQYAITYAGMDGAEAGEHQPTSHTYGTATTISDPTKTGYTFAGWRVNGSSEAVKNLTLAAEGYTAAIALTATWTANQYAITYAGLDGAEAGEHQPTSHTYGTETTISNPTKTGYTFAGWLVNGSSEAVKNLTLGADDYTAAIALTATWAANSYTVVFDANGGSGAMAAQVFTYDAAQALAAASFTRAGYSFAGWNTTADGSGTSFADGANVVNLNAEDGASVTLYAQWTEDAKYTLSGQVTESDDTAAAGATITLMQGAEEITQTTTDSSGRYVFTNIPAGVYNIVTEKEEVTTTTMVTVDADLEMMPAISLPAGNKNTVVDNSEAGAFAATVGGLNEIAAAETVDDGETVTITLAVTEQEDVTNSTAAEDATLKEEQAAIKQEAGGRTLAFLDLSLLKTTTQNGVEGTPENIGGSNNNLLTIVVPFATDNRRTITVYRYHGTAAEALPEGSENAVNGEYFSVDEGVVTICAKKFSTYAIGYANPPSGGGVAPAPIVTESEHGSVSLSPSRPSVGQTVTITPQPEEGYTVTAVTVSDASGQALTVTKNHDGTWSYKQPRGQVTIAVTFRLASTAGDCPQDDNCPLAAYSDLQQHAWYHDGVHYCLEEGLMVGTAPGVFSPNAALTRAQAVVILWRSAGSSLVEQPLEFNDVADDAWYADAVRWAVAADVMKGYGNGRFGADDTLTREQLAAVFHRLAVQQGWAETDGAAVDLDRFSDANAISGWALDVVQWACNTGLLRGFEDGRLEPGGNTTRAQFAAMILRFLEDVAQ